MFASLALLLGAGCATLTRGSDEVLVIETEPIGAFVRISSGDQCATPCSMKLKRKKDYELEITKAGYEPVRMKVLSQVVGAGAAGMAGNVVLGGLIGAGVDAATGATRGLRPNPVKVKLSPEVTAGPSAPDSREPAAHGEGGQSGSRAAPPPEAAAAAAAAAPDEP